MPTDDDGVRPADDEKTLFIMRVPQAPEPRFSNYVRGYGNHHCTCCLALGTLEVPEGAETTLRNAVRVLFGSEENESPGSSKQKEKRLPYFDQDLPGFPKEENIGWNVVATSSHG